ncbi:unnamed protein product [Nezara viridula]|uniref:Uncharacterized protein n=1 Tax=Nezara viridula TaxID=85310 RepID=A0A9P0H4E4_NEZVI|nr:unnamed protein product [Nezara viridula]
MLSFCAQVLWTRNDDCSTEMRLRKEIGLNSGRNTLANKELPDLVLENGGREVIGGYRRPWVPCNLKRKRGPRVKKLRDVFKLVVGPPCWRTGGRYVKKKWSELANSSSQLG